MWLSYSDKCYRDANETRCTLSAKNFDDAFSTLPRPTIKKSLDLMRLRSGFGAFFSLLGLFSQVTVKQEYCNMSKAPPVLVDVSRTLVASLEHPSE